MPSSDPILIAVAVVEHEGRVLIGKRPPGGPLPGLWEFPGGKVEPNETPEQTAARECREETGLTVRIGRLHLEQVYTHAHGPVRLFFFAAEPADPSQPPAEPFRWVPVQELPSYEMPAANAALVRHLAGHVPPMLLV
jgi:mutator protein MutT